MGLAPVPILVLSGRLDSDAQAAAAALAAGALDALPKDALDLLHPAGADAHAFRRRLAMLSGTRVIRHPRGRRPPGGGRPGAERAGPARSASAPRWAARTRCSSSSAALPATFPVPILVAQHMAVGFADGFARLARCERGAGRAASLGRAKAITAASGSHRTTRTCFSLRTAGSRCDRPTPAEPNAPSGDVLLQASQRPWAATQSPSSSPAWAAMAHSARRPSKPPADSRSPRTRRPLRSTACPAPQQRRASTACCRSATSPGNCDAHAAGGGPVTALEIIASVVTRRSACGWSRPPSRAPCRSRRAWPGSAHAEDRAPHSRPRDCGRHARDAVDEITIKETSFLRDHRQLDSIDWTGLQALAAAQGARAARVWSAACATGEEPYSLALLACEAFASTTPPVTILATDISPPRSPRGSAALPRARRAGVEEPCASATSRAAARRPGGRSGAARARLRSHRTTSSAMPAPRRRGALPPDPLPQRPDLLRRRDLRPRRRGARARARARGQAACSAPQTRCACSSARRRSSACRPARDRTRPARLVSGDGTARGRCGAAAAGPDASGHHGSGLHYLHGVAELEAGNARAAVSSLRRVLYLDPDFELAAFALGRAHEEAGEPVAARRRYEQALRMLDARPEPGARLAGPIDARPSTRRARLARSRRFPGAAPRPQGRSRDESDLRAARRGQPLAASDHQPPTREGRLPRHDRCGRARVPARAR